MISAPKPSRRNSIVPHHYLPKSYHAWAPSLFRCLLRSSSILLPDPFAASHILPLPDSFLSHALALFALATLPVAHSWSCAFHILDSCHHIPGAGLWSSPSLISSSARKPWAADWSSWYWRPYQRPSSGCHLLLPGALSSEPSSTFPIHVFYQNIQVVDFKDPFECLSFSAMLYPCQTWTKLLDRLIWARHTWLEYPLRSLLFHPIALIWVDAFRFGWFSAHADTDSALLSFRLAIFTN